ncbi:phospholipid/cholesterol/gamma-HCH transport system substrate-binding protein [Massilia sp. MP_M2]|uniref:outer membrane lipid asymmetry maintenance protein MlaD n=1 Tax=Massilia sp. MP_M2 TaxID=3071713 RepID=UPI00319E6401
MHRKTIDVWVGLFVLLGLAALLFLAFQAGNLKSMSFGQTYSVSGRFDNIGGLKPQAPVKSAGVVVGRVGQIAFDDKSFQASVRLDLDTDYKFPKDSSLKILTAGLLGEQYIGIEAGGDTNNLAEGDRIIRTQSATVLEDLINQFIYSKAADGKEGSQ